MLISIIFLDKFINSQVLVANLLAWLHQIFQPRLADPIRLPTTSFGARPRLTEKGLRMEAEQRLELQPADSLMDWLARKVL